MSATLQNGPMKAEPQITHENISLVNRYPDQVADNRTDSPT